jgi:uroporphyrinogen decarboxylase
MNHRERFFATIHNLSVDHPASWLALPVTSAEPSLMKYFGVSNIDQLRNAIDDDTYPIKYSNILILESNKNGKLLYKY